MGTRRKNPGRKDDERTLREVRQWRDLIEQATVISAQEADPPIDVANRLKIRTSAVTYKLPGIAVTIDFATLCHDVLVITDSVFASTFGEVVRRQLELRGRVN